jgi:peptide/nickel transport system substrate-binding protein
MCGLLILLTLLACARGGLPESVDLVVALDTTPQTLDPRFATDAASVHTLQLITDGLYRIDPEGRPVPNLAAEGRYEAPDRFRVELRSGVRFHDGRRLTARDVVATYRSVRSPETASPLQQELASVREVRADGDQVVLFELEGPFAPLLYKLAGVAILPESQVRSPEPIEAPIGTGPYRLREFSRGEYVMLDAYPGYHHGRPRSEHVLLRVVPTAATRALELLKGSVHLVVNGLPPYLVGALERKPGSSRGGGTSPPPCSRPDTGHDPLWTQAARTIRSAPGGYSTRRATRRPKTELRGSSSPTRPRRTDSAARSGRSSQPSSPTWGSSSRSGVWSGARSIRT